MKAMQMNDVSGDNGPRGERGRGSGGALGRNKVDEKRGWVVWMDCVLFS